MSQDHPFPFSKSTADYLKRCFPFDYEKLLRRLDLPVGFREDKPLLLLAIDKWHAFMSARMSVLTWSVDKVLMDVFPESEETSMIYGILETVRANMEDELNRLGELVTWAMATWTDDPVIKGHFAEKEPEPTAH